MTSIFQHLLLIDIFATPVNVFIHQQDQYRTLSGAFVTVLILSFTAFSFASMLLDLLQNPSPNIFSKLDSTPNPTVFLITSYHFSKVYNMTNDNFLISGLGDY